MKLFKVFFAVLILSFALCGCNARKADTAENIFQNVSAPPAAKAAEPKTPEIKAAGAKTEAPKMELPKALDQKEEVKAPEQEAVKISQGAPLQNEYVERSNLFQGSHVVLAGEYLYMSDPDLEGLYLVSLDGKEARQVTDISCSNLIYWDGYVYYTGWDNELSYDLSYTSFYRVKAGSTEAEVVMPLSFKDFFIADGDLYYYETIGDFKGTYYESFRNTLYRASLESPADREVLYRENDIFRAWMVDGKIHMLAQGDESEYPPYYYTNIIELDPQNGTESLIYTDDGFIDDIMPYKGIYIMRAHVFDVFAGDDCVLSGWDPEWPKSYIFTQSGNMSLDGETQYMLKGDNKYEDNFSQSLIESKNWGHGYKDLLNLEEYINEGYYPNVRIFRAGNCLYLYVFSTPYDYELYPDRFIICYNIENGQHSIMDAFNN